MRETTTAGSTARVPLAVGAWAATCLATLVVGLRSEREGGDFVIGIWAPVRALLRGIDPFDGASRVEGIDAAHVAAPLYAPIAYLVHLPLLVLDRRTAGATMTMLCIVLLWAALVVLFHPRSAPDWLLLAVAGGLASRTMMVEGTVFLGQYAAWTLLGVALALHGVRCRQSWLTALGFAVAAAKPQLAIPLTACLLLLGLWRVLARTALVGAVLSAPGAVAALIAAGGVRGLAHSIADNYDIYNHLRWNRIGSPVNTRADGLAGLAHLGGPSLDGAAWSMLALAVVTALAAVVLVPAGRHLGERALLDARVWWAVAACLVVPMYHQPYDLLVTVVPIVLTVQQWPALRRADHIVLGGLGSLLVLVELAGRVRYQQALARLLQVSDLSTQHAFDTVPTLILGALLVGVVLARPRQVSS